MPVNNQLRDSASPAELATHAKTVEASREPFSFLIINGGSSSIRLALAVLDHFHVQHDVWLDTLEKFEQTFGHAVGSPDTLTAVAERMGVKHMKGIAACRAAFT